MRAVRAPRHLRLVRLLCILIRMADFRCAKKTVVKSTLKPPFGGGMKKGK